ncbi:hypothetical protein IWZ01DRAFT_516397 [Phyllosticta capitalensis]
MDWHPVDWPWPSPEMCQIIFVGAVVVILMEEKTPLNVTSASARILLSMALSARPQLFQCFSLLNDWIMISTEGVGCQMSGTAGATNKWDDPRHPRQWRELRQTMSQKTRLARGSPAVERTRHARLIATKLRLDTHSRSPSLAVGTAAARNEWIGLEWTGRSRPWVMSPIE